SSWGSEACTNGRASAGTCGSPRAASRPRSRRSHDTCSVRSCLWPVGSTGSPSPRRDSSSRTSDRELIHAPRLSADGGWSSADPCLFDLEQPDVAPARERQDIPHTPRSDIERSDPCYRVPLEHVTILQTGDVDRGRHDFKIVFHEMKPGT